MLKKPETVRQSVREYYASRATNSQSCCGDETQFYNSNLLAELPEDVAEFSLGCGDAISLANFQLGETVLYLGSGGGWSASWLPKWWEKRDT